VAFFQWRYKNPKRTESELSKLENMINMKFNDLHNLGEKREQMKKIREDEQVRV
jgi:hypothetical protein